MKSKILFLLLMAVISAGGYAAEQTQDAPEPWTKAARKTLRGYKAFYEAGYSFDRGVEKCRICGEHIPDGNMLDVTTSQGYQFNNFFYLGGGIGLRYYTNKLRKQAIAPVFCDLRVNFMNTRFSPIFNYRTGLTFGCVNGWFLNPQLGVRMSLPKKHAVYVVSEYFWGTKWGWDSWLDHYGCFENWGFKVGYEF